MTTVTRRAVPSDAGPLTDLHLDCWDDAYTGLVPQPLIDARRADRDARQAMWTRTLDGGIPTWVADLGGVLVGFASAGRSRDDDLPDVTEVWSLYARASVWGAGVGHALLVEAIGVRPAYLWVLAGNDRAIGFYQRQGFGFDGHEQPSAEGLHLRMVRR